MTEWCTCNKLKEAEEKAAKWDALAQTTHSCPCGARQTTRIVQGLEGKPFGENIIYPLMCEACGWGISASDNYCRNCGAKVVGE